MRRFTVIECEQRSPEWHAARLGLVTGSSADDMMKYLKDGKTEAAARRNLRVRLALERVVGRPVESDYQSAAMKQGQEREADAVSEYEYITGRIIQSTGFLKHDELAAGCSLDGHVGDFEGVVEIKCPLPATHLTALRTKRVPPEYVAQVQHNVFICGAKWADWFSYNPDFPEGARLVLVRVTFSEFEQMTYRRVLEKFLAEVDAEEASIRSMVVQSA